MTDQKDPRAQNLSQKAMLVSLKIKRWSGVRNDKDAGAALASLKKANPERAGKYSKNVIDTKDPHVKAIREGAGKARNHFYGHSVPWDDSDGKSNGPRMVTTLAYDELMGELGKFQEQFDRDVKACALEMPRLKADAQGFLGDMFVDSEYPEGDEFIALHSFEVDMTFMPDNDPRLDIKGEEYERIKAEIEAKTQAKADNVTVGLADEMTGVMLKLVERMEAFGRDEDGKIVGDFHDTLIGNIVHVAKKVGAYNIQGDKDLDKARRDMIHRLTAHTPADLKQDADLRAEVKGAAKDIMADMADLYGDGDNADAS